MYKLKSPSDKQLSDFYDAYAPRIQFLMQELANGNITIPITLGNTQPIHLILKVQTNGEIWKFLVKYSQEANLRKLLCGNWNNHIEIVEEVCQSFPDLSWQQRMTKKDYVAGLYPILGHDASGNNIVEDFNEIMYWLFVVKLFDGKNNEVHLDKTAFVKERGLSVCPYCGRLPIDVAEVEGSVSKPYIDHFLPKRKYPFLAMSYLNLIPACNTCNDNSNKGDYDPILYPNYDLRLVNPHEFYDAAVTFYYFYNYQGENDEKNFKVLSKTANYHLEEGYLKTLKLRKFYSHQTLEVKDCYRRFTTATDSLKKFLYNLGINKGYLQNLEERTLGYRLNENEAPRRLMYKFKKDLFLQLKREHGM